jgi:hypothetical protein
MFSDFKLHRNQAHYFVGNTCDDLTYPDFKDSDITLVEHCEIILLLQGIPIGSLVN